MPADEAEEKMNSKMDVDVIAKKKGGDGTEQKDQPKEQDYDFYRMAVESLK